MPAVFQYRLRPLPDILRMWEAGGYDAQHYLSNWFWLTDGWYMFNTHDGPLPTSHPVFVTRYHLTEDQVVGIDYQVARLWMDLQDTLPAALEPLPEPFAGWVSSGAWSRWIEDTLAWWRGLDDQDWRTPQSLADALSTARGWWNVRHLDLAYLAAAPDVRFWRIQDTVTLEWDTRARLLDGVPCWVETVGRQVFSLAAFKQEVAGFQARFDADMQERLREVEALQMLDAQQLADLQRQHDLTIQQEGRWEAADWMEVQVAIAQLEAASGIRLTPGSI